MANLEALYIARELHPGRGIAYSAEAHYTHSRMCGVLGVPGTAVAVDGAGRMDLAALDAASTIQWGSANNDVGTMTRGYRTLARLRLAAPPGG